MDHAQDSHRRNTATAVGSYPVLEDPEEAIRTLERRSVTGTEELDEFDIVEETPARAYVASLPPPRAPLRRTAAPTPRGMTPWIVGGVAIGILASLGAAVVMRIVDAKTPYPRTSVTVVQATGKSAGPSAPTPPTQSSAGASIPSVGLDTLPIVASTHGTLRFPASARGHRVFNDGVVQGDTDAPFDVRCGTHSIRVGSRGELRAIDVPCGGTLDVSR